MIFIHRNLDFYPEYPVIFISTMGIFRIWILKYEAFISKIEEFHTLEPGILENLEIFISKFSGVLFILGFFLYFIIIY